MELNQPSKPNRARHWAEPLLLFVVVAPITSLDAGHTATLQLPTAAFAQFSPLFMLLFVAISFFIPSQKLASLLWWLGIGCIAYAPLLLWIGSVNIPLTRHLTKAESAEFKQLFPVRMVIKSSGLEGSDLYVKKQDYHESMNAYIQGIGAFRTDNN